MENPNNLTYEVRSSEELGRYLVAAHDLQPGDMVLSERPIVFGPKAMPDPEASMPCVGCYKPVLTDAGERCAKCGWPVCTGNCPGLRDPRHHGIECEILQARPECVLDGMAEYYRHDALMPLRCALLQISDPDSWKIIMQMESHIECRAPGTEVYEEADEFIVQYLMNSFIRNLEEDKRKKLPTITPEMLHKICGIIDTNALEIRLKDGVELLSLYPNTILMEHSCIPNTKHTFNVSTKDRSDVYRITIKVVVPVNKDEHITTMYSHALWGTQARRQHLKDTKYFLCKCTRCSDPTELGTYFSAMRCLGDGSKLCDGIHLPEDPLDNETDWACNKCPMKINNSQVNMLMTQMAEQVEDVQMMGGSIQMLETLIFRLSTFLHPNHYHLYSLKHSLVQLLGRQPGYVSEEILDRKIKICNDLIQVTKTLDPGNARLSLYMSVLKHELYSALVMKSKAANADGTPKSVEEIKTLVEEAKTALKDAIDSLKDDTEETSGQKLISVLEESKRCFERYCKERKVYV